MTKRNELMGAAGKRLLVFVLASLLTAHPVFADRVTLPAGAVVYGKILERVTSRKGDTFEGDLVQAVVWRDVIVNRKVIVKAGTPMAVKVSMVKRAKMAGIKGQIELRAFSTTAMDDTHVPLVGGYDKSGRSKMALSITLGALFIIPIVIKGKQAILESGTVFDAQVQANTELEIESETPRRTIRLGGGESLSVEILYDEIPDEGKIKVLPMELELCGEVASSAAVVAVNEHEIPAIPISLSGGEQDDDCAVFRGEVDLKSLGEHFTRGVNRFEVKLGSEVVEVVLEIEL